MNTMINAPKDAGYVWARKTPKCRNDYHCRFCGKLINKGEKAVLYLVQTETFKAGSIRFHPEHDPNWKVDN